MPSVIAMLKPLLGTLAGVVGIYAASISLVTIPTLQDHAIYLHRVKLTWFQDVRFPEYWGFLCNQVTSFHLETLDREILHAWHVLPLEAYRRHQNELHNRPDGLCADIEQHVSFTVLKDDPTAQLVIFLHGAAGTWFGLEAAKLSSTVFCVHKCPRACYQLPGLSYQYWMAIRSWSDNSSVGDVHYDLGYRFNCTACCPEPASASNANTAVGKEERGTPLQEDRPPTGNRSDLSYILNHNSDDSSCASRASQATHVSVTNGTERLRTTYPLSFPISSCMHRRLWAALHRGKGAKPTVSHRRGRESPSCC